MGDLKGDARQEVLVADDAGDILVFARAEPDRRALRSRRAGSRRDRGPQPRWKAGPRQLEQEQHGLGPPQYGGRRAEPPADVRRARDFATGVPGVSGGSLAVGDLNHDGNPDVVTANQNSTVSVLLGAGNGDLTQHHDYATGGGVGDIPRAWVAIGDLNNDGHPDLATSNGEQAGSISVLLNTRTVRSPPGYAIPITGPGEIEIADFDQDRNLDLATASSGANFTPRPFSSARVTGRSDRRPTPMCTKPRLDYDRRSRSGRESGPRNGSAVRVPGPGDLSPARPRRWLLHPELRRTREGLRQRDFRRRSRGRRSQRECVPRGGHQRREPGIAAEPRLHLLLRQCGRRRRDPRSRAAHSGTNVLAPRAMRRRSR